MMPSDFRIPRSSVAGMSDHDLCWAVVDRVWPAADVADELELEHIAQATPGQRAVYTTMLYSQEVDNGGIKQFLSNSSGLYSQCVLEGLRLLGATELYSGFEQVTSYFPEGQIPVDREVRRHILDTFSDEQWAGIGRHEDTIYRQGGFFTALTPYWTAFIHQCPDDFFL